jgi:hypothetical protein
MKSIFLGAFCSLLALSCLGQTKHTISGYIKDATNGEVLIGGTVVIHELETGTISNEYGFYSITLPDGNYQITYKYMGYNDVQNTLNLAQDIRMDVELPLAKNELDEVVITGRPIDENVQGIEMSILEMDISLSKNSRHLWAKWTSSRACSCCPGWPL